MLDSENDQDMHTANLVARLMHEFPLRKWQKICIAEFLQTEYMQLKETQKGVEFMCQEMEQICYEGEKSGKLYGQVGNGQCCWRQKIKRNLVELYD